MDITALTSSHDEQQFIAQFPTHQEKFVLAGSTTLKDEQFLNATLIKTLALDLWNRQWTDAIVMVFQWAQPYTNYLNVWNATLNAADSVELGAMLLNTGTLPPQHGLVLYERAEGASTQLFKLVFQYMQQHHPDAVNLKHLAYGVVMGGRALHLGVLEPYLDDSTKLEIMVGACQRNSKEIMAALYTHDLAQKTIAQLTTTPGLVKLADDTQKGIDYLKSFLQALEIAKVVQSSQASQLSGRKSKM